MATIVRKAKATSQVASNLDAVSGDNRPYRVEKIKFFKDGSCNVSSVNIGFKNEDNATQLRIDVSELLWNWIHLIEHHSDVATDLAHSFNNHYNFKLFFKSQSGTIKSKILTEDCFKSNNFIYFKIPEDLTLENSEMFLIIEEKAGDWRGNIEDDAEEDLTVNINISSEDEDPVFEKQTYPWKITERFVSDPIKLTLQDTIYTKEDTIDYDKDNSDKLLNQTYQLEGLVKPKLFGRLSDKGQLLICSDENFIQPATSFGRQFDSYVTYILFDPSSITGHVSNLSKFLFFKKDNISYCSPIEKMEIGHDDTLDKDYAYVCWIPAGVTAEKGDWQVCFFGEKTVEEEEHYLFLSSAQTLNVKEAFGSYLEILGEDFKRFTLPSISIQNISLSEDDMKLIITLEEKDVKLAQDNYGWYNKDSSESPDTFFNSYEISFDGTNYERINNEDISTKDENNIRRITYSVSATNVENVYIKCDYIVGAYDNGEYDEWYPNTKLNKQDITFNPQGECQSQKTFTFKSPIYYGYLTKKDEIEEFSFTNSYTINENIDKELVLDVSGDTNYKNNSLLYIMSKKPLTIEQKVDGVFTLNTPRENIALVNLDNLVTSTILNQEDYTLNESDSSIFFELLTDTERLKDKISKQKYEALWFYNNSLASVQVGGFVTREEKDEEYYLFSTDGSGNQKDFSEITESTFAAIQDKINQGYHIYMRGNLISNNNLFYKFTEEV